MFAVLYQGTIKEGTELEYQAAWRTIATYFKNHCGALGSCLHCAEDGSWIAYSRWPNKATRDAAWAPQNMPSEIPSDIKAAVSNLTQCFENGYTEIGMEIIEDLLV